MPIFRRFRGVILRLVFNRVLASLGGIALLGTFFFLRFIEFKWETWLSDGLTLLLGATGNALLFVAFQGREPDWIDPAE